MNPIILADNRFRDGIPTATSTASGYDVRALCDRRAWTTWRANTIATQSIAVDCGVAKVANCVGILGHNLHSVAASLQVYASANGSSWSNLTNALSPTTDFAYMARFTQGSYRYWAVNVYPTTGIPEIAELVLGAELQFPDPPTPPFDPYGEEVEAETTLGKTGNVLGSIVRYNKLSIMANFKNLDRTWVRSTYYPFWRDHAAKLYPFFWAWDLDYAPDDVFFATYKDPVKYKTPLSLLPVVDSLSLDLYALREV